MACVKFDVVTISAAADIGGTTIDFDVAVEDVDNGTRENQMVWCGDSHNYRNRAHFGRLHFKE